MMGGPGLGPVAGRGVLDLIECLSLGAAVILHNRESGAMVASNAFGALLIDHLGRHRDVAAAVAAIAADLARPEAEVGAAVTDTLARWTGDGLFLTAARPFPGAVPYRPAAGAPLGLALDGRAARLTAEDSALAEDIARALASMRLAAPTGSEAAATRLEVIAAGEGFGLFRDGSPVWGVAGYELTRFHLLREVMDILLGPETLAAHLHASAVASGGAGLVFAGASGSGKSTLATLLVAAGAALAADDHVALGIDGGTIRAFPTRPNLKPGAAALPEVAAVIAGQGAGPGDFGPAARLPAGASVRLAGFVFPRYDPAGDNALTPLDPAEALRRLIQTGSRVSRSTRSLAPLARALAAQPVCELGYRDSGFAVEACLGLLDG